MNLSPESPLPARRSWLFRGMLIVLSLVLTAAVSEGILRLFFKNRLQVIEDERYLLYRYDATLGWFPVPNTRQRLKASRVFTVAHNSQGFRGPELRYQGKPGILFLGDSYVWGYDVEAEERFTDKLQASHPEWSIFNAGVSGYGTDQEYLVLQKYIDACKPRVVFLLFCIENDDEDNSTNERYEGYYKPYCITENNRLLLKGIPVPRSERAWLSDHPQLNRVYLARLLSRACFNLTAPPKLLNPNPTGAIIRDMQKFVQSKGAVLLVGLTGRNPKLEEFLNYFEVPYVDLSTQLRYPEFGQHWTPEGHSYICEQIAEFLKARKVL